MRWKAHFFLKEDSNDETKQERESYGFKTRKCPPQCQEMENFEKDVMNIVKNLELRKIKDEFQDRLKEDVKKINASLNILFSQTKLAIFMNRTPKNKGKSLRKTSQKHIKKHQTTLNMKSTLKRKK